ncbi:MAG: sugar phosphate isomerase/epimerase family protein, partial [Bacteroidota bacterium]
FSRKTFMKSLAGIAASAALPLQASTPTRKHKAMPFSFCLNTSTIMGQALPLMEELDIAAQAGYDGIEIWIRSLEKHVQEGGSLADVQKKAEDLGIRIENAIGFAQWIVDDHDTRTQALEQAKREMDMLAQVGCRRIAAPPAGATEKAGLDLKQAAERYRALCELGEEMGVQPQLEVWGFSQNLSRLSEVLYVAAESGFEDVKILPDVYHLYKGGSDADGLSLIHPKRMEIFHLNDYPDIPNDQILDKDRVYPGEGIAPIPSILNTISSEEYPSVLSLELFNRDYWKMPALDAAKKGLEAMKKVVGTQ